jgi:Uma2 family endonuclease
MTMTTTPVAMPVDLDRAGVIALNEADEFHRYELTPDGALIVTPPPDTDHGEICMQLAAWLMRYGADPGLIKLQSGVEIGDGMRIPDLMLLRARVARTSAVPPSRVALAVEVISPSTRTQDRVVKPGEYATAGIPYYWLVEPTSTPLAATVVRYSEPHGGRYLVGSAPVTLASLIADETPELLGLELR